MHQINFKLVHQKALYYQHYIASKIYFKINHSTLLNGPHIFICITVHNNNQLWFYYNIGKLSKTCRTSSARDLFLTHKKRKVSVILKVLLKKIKMVKKNIWQRPYVTHIKPKILFTIWPFTKVCQLWYKWPLFF